MVFIPSYILNFLAQYSNIDFLRSSHQRCSMKKGVLGNFTNFTGKHLCQSLFFYTLADLRPATLFKKRLWHKCFPVNFTKFLRTPFLQNTSGGCFYFLDIYGSQDIVFEHRVDSRYCETLL